MEQWEQWSAHAAKIPAPLRSAVLHAWLTHVHPWLDGNGRTARAVGNLELIRAGFPPIIIKRSERTRYIDALAQSDQAGDIRLFLELILDKVELALLGLERSVKATQNLSVWTITPNFVPVAQFRSLGHFDFESAFPVVRHLKNWHGSGAAPPPWFSTSVSAMAPLSTGRQGAPSPFLHGSPTQTTRPSLSNSQPPPAMAISGLQDSLTTPSGPSRPLTLSAESLNPCFRLRNRTDAQSRGPHRSNSGTQKVQLRTQQESLEWRLSSIIPLPPQVFHRNDSSFQRVLPDDCRWPNGVHAVCHRG